MAKHTYYAKAPDGQVFTRTTDRAYSHVIVAKHSDEFWNSAMKKYREEQGDTRGNVFFAATWAGNPQLAEKALRAQQAQRECLGWDKRGKKIFGNLMHKNVQAIPCHLKG